MKSDTSQCFIWHHLLEDNRKAICTWFHCWKCCQWLLSTISSANCTSWEFCTNILQESDCCAHHWWSWRLLSFFKIFNYHSQSIQSHSRMTIDLNLITHQLQVKFSDSLKDCDKSVTQSLLYNSWLVLLKQFVLKCLNWVNRLIASFWISSTW